MTDLADEIYEATGMILGTQQAAAMTAFVRTREAAARHEAADEIERLRAALRRIAHSADYDTIVSPDGDRHQRAIQIALEALTEGGR